MVKGSCLCGGITFKLDPEAIALFNQCYCQNCRKETGTAHTSQIAVATQSFSFLTGEEMIELYESSPGHNRAFCRKCGSRLPTLNTNGVYISVPVGLLDDDLAIQPEISINTQSKASWDKLDPDMVSIPDQGSEAFWHEFMSNKTTVQ